MVRMPRFFFLLLGLFLLAFALGIHGQQEGFISIDCGIDEDLSYTDDLTQIHYISDSKFIETGINLKISSDYVTQKLPQQYRNLRSFPDGSRNCYTLTTVAKSNRYLVRASFMYGNYDGRDSPPQFDIYVGVNRWDTVTPLNASLYYWNEIITVATMDYMSVCLVNTGHGTPIISTLELRVLHNSSYQAANESQSLVLYGRSDVGSTSGQIIRYPVDIYDRVWDPWVSDSWTSIKTAASISLDNGYEPPLAVMNTAAIPSNASANLTFFVPTSSLLHCHMFMHFAELQQLQNNQSREFNISIDGKYVHGPFSPPSLAVHTLYTISPLSGLDQHQIEFYKTQDSTLPPILNAVETFIMKPIALSPTKIQEVDAITNIKDIYQVKRNWMGDPCVPESYRWDGLKCSYSGSGSPTIISLDLASSGLTGEIDPSLANLTSISSLDLSNNSLTGPVPDFLAELPLLKFLNLSNNKLTGAVPTVLSEKSKSGSLTLSVSNNPNLVGAFDEQNHCQADSCKKGRKFVVPVIVSVISALLLLTIIAFILWKFTQRRRRKAEELVTKASEVASEEAGTISQRKNKDGSLHFENRRFTYSEIIRITNQFERVIGKGGSGVVYHGYMNDGAQVAIKMLSQSSFQGSKQFRNEAELLMRVHHRNLASFIGYCEEDRNKAIIYEYMAKGNLQEHLLGAADNVNVLSWRTRLQVAADSAQGLEYLHCGCKPPIVHRDVKATNILLNERLEAKIADFGVSKVFPEEGLTHVSTAVMGTPGYLDPEYYISNKLNEKSDVYSFGIVLLELITGKPAIIINSSQRSERIHIVQWVDPILARGDIANVVDPRLKEEYDVNSAWKAIEIAMACTLDTAIQRPDMSFVASELKECLVLVRARERTWSLRNAEVDGTSNSIEMVSKNMGSMTVPLPR